MAAAVEPVWQATSPDSLDDDLAQLWEQSSASGPVSRAVMSNLVVVRPRDAAGSVTPALDEVLRRHPARTILIDYSAGMQAACSPESIAINLLVFAGGAERYGVERIAVKTACAEGSLPSVVRRLVRGDVPTSLWWAADASRQPIAYALAEEVRQLVYDSADWTDIPRGVSSIVATVRRPARLDLADLNWRRLAPLRQAIRHAVALEGRAHFDQGFRTRVAFGPGHEAAAWLLAAWLHQAQIRPENDRRPEVAPADAADVLISASMETPHDRLSAVWSPSDVRVQIGAGAMPIIVPSPSETTGAAIAAELDNLGREGALRATLISLASLIPNA